MIGNNGKCKAPKYLDILGLCAQIAQKNLINIPTQKKLKSEQSGFVYKVSFTNKYSLR
jgi:hypothetical protein